MAKTLATETLAACRERGEKIVTAESCTGGMVAAQLTSVAGSSDVMERGFVTYSNDAKVEMLGVRMETLNAHGAVSEDVAAEMAVGALSQSKADIAVSVTGIAGPGGSDHKPEGRVCFGLSTPEATVTSTVEFGALGRSKVRKKAMKFALRALRDKRLD
ncbi:CinA family protein [Amylibacter sp. IMCC11727]|uniref:CinA family protein n=1 Tax=Amylibacter sp. IMCC11727 TaxID=3039851 RepID=UPI00244DAF5D|nr:CinA family protein [Amylibacter sp. IMCC11727]WGI20341.1 CinA family protein [Amylibacter sp. IMCC11727]